MITRSTGFRAGEGEDGRELVLEEALFEGDRLVLDVDVEAPFGHREIGGAAKRRRCGSTSTEAELSTVSEIALNPIQHPE